MKHFYFLVLTFAIKLSAAEFTVSSYNCGGLSWHYDYLRAASMEVLMQERYLAEPLNMAQNEKIQKLALKILFASDPLEKALALQEWQQKGYLELSEKLTKAPTAPNSINTIWNEKAENFITSYKVRPVVIHNEKVKKMLDDHLNDLSPSLKTSFSSRVQEARSTMATRIFADHLNYDILCLQEADYLDKSMFPSNYEVLFSDTDHSRNGVAWNQERFKLVDSIGNVLGRAFAVKLREKDTGKTVLVASGHITGCNPYKIDINPKTGIADSAKGDSELQAIIDLFDEMESDFKVIGMDSNVTSLHPRLELLKNGGYKLDYENYLEPTCANPYQVLNTRIDWISLKTNETAVSIENIPVMSVGLNNIKTNISDHKPIAAKITY